MKLSLKRSFLLFGFFFCFCFFSASKFSYGMVIAPSTINLNAECEGEFQDVQAIIGGYGAPDCITGCDIGFYIVIENIYIPILYASSVRYCYVDDNYLISFNRLLMQEEFQRKLDANNLELDESIRVVVKGDVYCGDEITKYLEGESTIVIRKPGFKSK